MSLPSVVAHVDYVVPETGETVAALRFATEVISEPANAGIFVAGLVLAVAGAVGYLRYRPARRDRAVLVGTLRSYADLVPWMVRLATGLPLVGAGVAGYFFSPAVTDVPGVRLFQVAVGFLVLFGLATRAAAVVGLVGYLVGLVVHPELLLAMEYVPLFVALALLGSGRPSADQMLAQISSAEGTVYGRVDPVHRAADRFARLVAPYRRYAATVIRVGMGLTFVYLGLVQKFLHPGRTLLVVEKYQLTAVVPVDPGVWVLGAAVVEIALGLALVAGAFTRGVAALAFLTFTLTLFGLPDDPVLAHVTLFGMASAVFTPGSGPIALDRVLGADETQAEPGSRIPG
jgi:uncharacterized membrane protein YphA (DoxX/SURF4 family)